MSELKPKISVITVTFNAEDHIEKTIKTVLFQDYPDIEHVIVDGLSTDRTMDIIKKYDDSIGYWVSEPDGGIYDAMNKAILAMSGDFYIVMGADDTLFPGVITDIVNNYLIDGKIDYLITGTWLGDKILRQGIRPKLGWKGAHAMVNAHSVGMVIRKTVHEEVGMYSLDYPISADALFIKKLFHSNAKGISCDVILGRFALEGVSNRNLAKGLCENFLIQLKTESNTRLQVFLFIIRLAKNIFKF